MHGHRPKTSAQMRTTGAGPPAHRGARVLNKRIDLGDTVCTAPRPTRWRSAVTSPRPAGVQMTQVSLSEFGDLI